jgi:cysteine-rich repeat protein
VCGGCADGLTCSGPGDCLGAHCVGNQGASSICGDGNQEGAETCDDGNTDSYDGCSALCQLPTTHLVISEVALGAAPYVEIYNPTAVPVALDDVYLADFATYYSVTTGGTPPAATEFSLRFPAGATIAAGAFATVSLTGAATFNAQYSQNPDFDLDSGDAGAPVMLGSFTLGTSSLDAAQQGLVLFTWNGSADLVTDVDYVVYGNAAAGFDKTGVMVNTSTYQPDTALGMQVAAPIPMTGGSLVRCDTAETSETKTGGNGQGAHDETSESGPIAWKASATATPGAAPATGVCP